MCNPLLAVFIVTHIGFVKGNKDFFFYDRFIVGRRIQSFGMCTGSFNDAVALAAPNQHINIKPLIAFHILSKLIFKSGSFIAGQEPVETG